MLAISAALSSDSGLRDSRDGPADGRSLAFSETGAGSHAMHRSHVHAAPASRPPCGGRASRHTIESLHGHAGRSASSAPDRWEAGSRIVAASSRADVILADTAPPRSPGESTKASDRPESGPWQRGCRVMGKQDGAGGRGGALGGFPRRPIWIFLAPADIVIEAVTGERRGVKRQIFRASRRVLVLRASARSWRSNTSSISITASAAADAAPGQRHRDALHEPGPGDGSSSR